MEQSHPSSEFTPPEPSSPGQDVRGVAEKDTRPGSLQPILAGITTALVGFTSSSAIVIAGLRAVGADLDQATSGLVALCLVQGLGIIWLALRHHTPITLAWSTPGAALLADAAGSSLAGASPGADPAAWSAAVGAFLVVAVLILLTGLWRGLSDLIARIPAALAQAMLAGVLLPLCLAPVHALTVSPLAVAPVIVVWLVLLRLAPKWAVPTAFALALVIAVAVAFAFATGVGRSADASVAPAFALASMLPSVSLTMPSFTLGAVLGIAAPLYLVTMVSQNVPGVAVMRANGFDVQWRESMLVTGVATAVAAPAGGHGREPGRDLRSAGGGGRCASAEKPPLDRGCHLRMQLSGARCDGGCAHDSRRHCT
ncbi:MAG: benzoate/H(+) symporter BenE family transporter [Pseudoclavibacter sp.]